MISVIIPAHKEIYLQDTITDILEKASGEIEVIVCLDGYWPVPQLIDDKRVKIIHSGSKKGMRHSINSAARMAKGKYLLKCDAHCMFADGFDGVLKKDCKPDWTLVPVRYSLDVNKWDRKIDKKYEFEYIASEDLKGKRWNEYANRVSGIGLPDLMTFQGSCWFMHKDRFFEIGGLDEENYGGMGREAQEICLKSWLSGGKCVLDRNTWYAHWSKGKKDIKFSNSKDKTKSTEFANEFWKNNKWDKQVRDLNWLVGHFAPVPTWEDVEKEKVMAETKIVDMVIPERILQLKVHSGMTRAGLYKMFADKGFKVGCEVGVQRGRNAFVMLENIPDLKLYLVEPYADHPSNDRLFGKKVHDKFRKQAHKRLEGRDVVWVEKFSEECFREIPDKTLDFVYIDGEHTWDYAVVDLSVWNNKVKTGGIISGHDFGYKGNKNYKHSGRITEALTHFTEIYKIPTINLTDKTVREHKGDRCSSWFFQKTWQ